MTLNPVETGGPEHDPELEHIYPAFDEVFDMSLDLGHQINQYCSDTGNRIDRIAVLPRGALYVAMVFSRMFHIEAPELINMSLTSYGLGQTTSDGTFRYGQLPTREEVEGLTILVPDDVIDSGKTEVHASEILLDMGAKEVITAALYDKVDMHKVDINPNFWVKQIFRKVWIHFPWELIEEAIDEPSVFSGNYYEQKLGNIARGAVLLDRK